MTVLLLMRKPLWAVVAAVLAFVTMLALGGFLFAWSGLYSVAASSGHWEITRWFLHFTMRSSVRTQALGTEVPDLGHPRLVRQGAGHFHTGCAPCHGTVKGDPPIIPRGMTPHPPLLAPVIDQWENDELFWLVKHGIKYTGMPAWPSLVRDDEVWAMVAFLNELPELNVEGYRRLALGDARDPGLNELAEPSLDALSGLSSVTVASCARCHGSDGLGGEAGAFPYLAGQSEEYLYQSLQSYAAGRRASGIMQPIADGLTERQQRSLASLFAGLPPGGAGVGDSDPALVALGARLAARGAPEEAVPSCLACHDSPDANPVYPRLAGQPAWYIRQQLYLFRDGIRGGTAYADLMQAVADELTDEHIAALAEYYAALAPDAPD